MMKLAILGLFFLQAVLALNSSEEWEVRFELQYQANPHLTSSEKLDCLETEIWEDLPERISRDEKDGDLVEE